MIPKGKNVGIALHIVKYAIKKINARFVKAGFIKVQLLFIIFIILLDDKG